jgi:hypothetical protein
MSQYLFTSNQTRSEDEGENEKHDKITELITITHKSTYGHSGLLVHLVDFDLQITKAASRRTLMHLLSSLGSIGLIRSHQMKEVKTLRRVR